MVLLLGHTIPNPVGMVVYSSYSARVFRIAMC